jgi:ABC-2 type transport system ATP-binding protein
VIRVHLADAKDGTSAPFSLSTSNTDVRRELAAAVVGAGFGLLEMRPMRVSLEDVFVSLMTEEKPAEEPAAPAAAEEVANA